MTISAAGAPATMRIGASRSMKIVALAKKMSTGPGNHWRLRALKGPACVILTVMLFAE
jgi:hypothetical protein